ncbi:RNase H domain-containing protein [Trichonephila clavipes]|nr:RNase H domain-containing protein [Trichonephila clavipes]
MDEKLLETCTCDTAFKILDTVVRLFSRYSIYFQWVHSHIGLNGNEIADSVAKSAIVDSLRDDTGLTFAELSSIKRIELNELWGIPPAHPWYSGKRPRWCHQLNISRDQQNREQGRKVFPECHRCEADQASPNHILNCLSYTFDEVLRNPVLFLDFLEIFGFMEIV